MRQSIIGKNKRRQVGRDIAFVVATEIMPNDKFILVHTRFMRSTREVAPVEPVFEHPVR